MTRAQRMLGTLLMLGGLAGMASGQARAQEQVPSLRMDLLVLVPARGALRVFQEVVANRAGTVLIPLLSEARYVRGIGARASSDREGLVRMATIRRRAAVSYEVPWNGHAAALMFSAPTPIREAAVLAPSGLSLPGLLNPWFAKVGASPGLTPGNRPQLIAYVSGPISPAQPVILVLEQAQAQAEAVQADHGARWVKRLMLGAIGAFCVGALVLGVSWSGVWPVKREARRLWVRRAVGPLARHWGRWKGE
ncbi:MAG: hypothetical protein OWU84_02520 [Firmicutes bacterium]|nr:hypothetical protein [Bacillota bacterium]